MLALNTNLQKLISIAQKHEKMGIGLMSGTSLDGLDIALCRFTGNGLQTKFSLVNFITIPYADAFKKEVQQVFARKETSLEKVCLLNEYIGSFHGELVLQALAKWHINPGKIDFIASHGQTIYHAPKRLHNQADYPNATLQIGDGDHLAVKTGIFTISDFRQKHLAAGGEGAPLALYGDVLLGGKPGEDRILLNIGGIANLTWLPADGDYAGIVCTDIGPGNTLIDAASRKYFDKPYDEDSKIAFSGSVNEALLNTLLDHPFFAESAPKTTGPELFGLNYVEDAQKRSATLSINNADLVCTLSAFTAKTITDFILQHFKADDIKIFASGGGAKNSYMIDQLKKAMPKATIAETGELGIDPDAKEAILFALLGNEALSGEPLAIGGNPAALMGKFSFPL
ncbi:anhydro-N-acetylmuramic acid kinase [Mucilaginibacter xinganensis]|uniref:Anhydro-N-acetylmuramic acid kinase n=1 Tax=Mucilaginibacter xinganensis TaxID=1234841 RepID=A0A223NRY0_9SPHI|nr:anhydro-N-acetylmuramic acid kinase [Mucilaginibacter xinganensis]ASU32444.1 anhydro-N-acetylmuramic acid kinase [Mucilaginibacter xinganensis]